MGKKGEFIQGMRVTDAETMDVVEMVLGGQVNKEIVELINQPGGKAVGLTGQDGAFIRAQQDAAAAVDKSNGKIDIGQVGEIERIDPEVIQALETARLHPGDRADRRRATTARPTTSTPTWSRASWPKILHAEKLVVLTNTTGVLDKNGKLLTGLTPKQDRRAVRRRHDLTAACCRRSARRSTPCSNGVKSVHIIDGRVEHALLLEVLTERRRRHDDQQQVRVRMRALAAVAAGVDLRPRQHAAQRAAAHLPVDARPINDLPADALRRSDEAGANAMRQRLLAALRRDAARPDAPPRHRSAPFPRRRPTSSPSSPTWWCARTRSSTRCCASAARKLVFSNAPRHYVEEVLRAIGLERYFDAVYTIEDTALPWQAGRLQGFHRLLRKHNLDPHRCAMVDDMLENLRTAQRLGMSTVWVSPAGRSRAVRRSAQSSSVTELPRRIQN